MYKIKKIDSKLYLFKGEDKIGEVSLDALSYVKEGDEFDKKDLQYVTKATYGNGKRCLIATISAMKFIDKAIGAERRIGDGYIQIKGPCGHFH